MGKRTISTKLVLDGEAEYKAAIKNINSELSLYKSELEKVQAQYKDSANSLDALTAKEAVLEKQKKALTDKYNEQAAMLEKAQQAQRQYAYEVEQSGGKLERAKAKLEELKASEADTSAVEAKLTAEIEKHGKALASAEAGMQKAANSVTFYQRQVNATERDQFKLNAELDQTKKYLDEAKSSADGFAHSIDQYGKEVKKAGESSEGFAQGTRQSIQGIEQLAAALAAAGVAKSVKEIADTLLECAGAAGSFETSMAKLSTLVDSSVYSLDGIRAELVELSNETGVSVNALAEAAYQARSAGVDAANVIDFVATATKTSAAGFTDSATAVDVLTTAINAYHMEGSEAEKVASMLVKTQDEGKTSVGELAQNMGRVIPVAAAYNVSLGNLTAAYAQLTKGGTNTAIATTNLTAMFNELAKGGSTVAGVLQEQTGQSFSQLMDSGKNLGQIMTILLDSVEGDATAFSNLWGSTTAGQAALSLLNSGAEEFTRTLGVMENSSGAVERNFQTMADTTEFAQQRMATAADNLKIAIGDQLNPALEKLYSTGADAFTWATDFVNENPAVVAALTATTIGMATLTAGVTLAANAENIMAASTAVLNAVMNANPAFLMAAAITGLVTAVGTFIVIAGSASDETRDFTKSLQESKSAYDDLMASMGAQQTSTVSTVAALKDLMAVENKSADQKKIMKQLVDDLNEAVPDLNLLYDQERDALVGMTAAELDAAAARAAAQEEHEAQVERLKELYVEKAEIEERLLKAEDDLTAAQEDLTDAQRAGGGQLVSYADGTIRYNSALEASVIAAGALERDVRELTAAQADNAAQIAELEAATSSYVDQQAEAERQAQAAASALAAAGAEVMGLQKAYEESYAAAMESINGQIGLFQKMDGEAKTTIEDLIGTLNGQVSYMEDYAANIKKAMEMGVDEGLIKKLSDGSEESAQILAAIVQGSETDIANLNAALADVDKGKEAFSTTVVEMEREFNEKMDEVSQDLADTIQELDHCDEAYEIARNNIQGLINGALSQQGALEAVYAEMGRASLAGYKMAVGQHSPSREFAIAAYNDVQGLIVAAEGEKDRLMATYAGLAKAALESYEATAAEGMAKLSAAFKELEGLLDTRGSIGDLEYQLWERTLGKDASDIEKYARQLDLLTMKQKDQQTVVLAAAEAYEAALAQYGAGTAESLKYQEALLKEKLALQDLKDEVESLNSARSEAAAQEGLERVKAFNEWAQGDRTTPFYFYKDIAGYDAAYEQTAQAVRDGMARHLPSTTEAPQAGAGLERSLESITAAAVNAISGIGGSGNDTPIVINLMFPDGTVFASYYFDPLTKFADANGTPILNPIK